MNTYRLTLTPQVHLPWAGYGFPALTDQLFIDAVEGVAVRELTTSSGGSFVVDLTLARPDHTDAMNELARFVQNLGYDVVDAAVTEWVDESVEWGAAGLLGGGAVGSTSRDPWMATLIAVLTTAAGAWAGSKIQKAKVIYRVRWTAAGWEFTPVQPGPRGAPVVRPAFPTA
jgi:hypothetical protein